MTASTLIVDYIGRGVFASRPTTPNIPAGATAVYVATDTGAIYAWNGSAWLTVGGGATTLDGLTDVTITSVAASDFLAYNSGSSQWTNRTPTATTALLSAVVGDSGSGGTKGLVPAPGSGDAAAGKFLKADGTFAVPSGGSTLITATFDASTSTVASTANCYAGAAAIATGLSSGDAYRFRAMVLKTAANSIAVVLTATKNATNGYLFQLNNNGTGSIESNTASINNNTGSGQFADKAGWVLIEGSITFHASSNWLACQTFYGRAGSDALVNFVAGELWCAIRFTAGSGTIGKVVFEKLAP